MLAFEWINEWLLPGVGLSFWEAHGITIVIGASTAAWFVHRASRARDAAQLEAITEARARARFESALASQSGQVTALRRGHEELERRLSERTAALHEAQTRADVANHVKSTSLAQMSFELRTPLHSVIELANRVQRSKGGALDTIELKHVELIRRHGQELLRIIDEVLDLARIEAGHVSLEESDVCVAALARDVCETLAGRAKGAGVTLELVLGAVARTAPAPVRADEAKLRQVLLNLVGNSLSFTPVGGRVRMTLHADPDTMTPRRLDVTHDGLGSPSAEQVRVFSPLEHADAATASRYGGSGLGLTIARGLCRAMGFDLTVTSGVGAGVAFSVIFPDA